MADINFLNEIGINNDPLNVAITSGTAVPGSGVNANITNEELQVNVASGSVDATLVGTSDVNVTNADLPVTVQNSELQVFVASGSVDANVTGSVDANITNEELSVSMSSGTVTLDNSQLAVSYGDSSSIDAFGRLRVSNPETLFDSKQLYDKAPLFWDEETSGGTEISTHSLVDASVTMTVNASGEYVIRQTYERFNYQPGKSQLVLLTFTLGTAASGVDKRIGYFNSASSGAYDENLDGIYLEQDGSTQYIVQCKSGTATSVAQANWNIDKMDGSGQSGLTIDWTKSQILFIDMEWLGVGRVRAGFVINGLVYYVHEFLNANSVSSVYMTTPNHSCRYEIRSTGGTASMQHICSSVMSEGGVTNLGILQYESTAGAEVTATTEGTIYALVGIRLKDTHVDSTVCLVNTAIQLQTATVAAEWLVIFNPTVVGAFSYSDKANSSVQTAIGTTTNTVTGGTVIAGGFIESQGVGKGGVGSAGSDLENALRLGVAIDGTRDTIVLCIRPVGGSSSVDTEGALFWRERV